MAKVPDTNTFSLVDVVNVTGGDDLQEAYALSSPALFDPRYEGSKNSLYNFRNYGWNPLFVGYRSSMGGVFLLDNGRAEGTTISIQGEDVNTLNASAFGYDYANKILIYMADTGTYGNQTIVVSEMINRGGRVKTINLGYPIRSISFANGIWFIGRNGNQQAYYRYATDYDSLTGISTPVFGDFGHTGDIKHVTYDINDSYYYFVAASGEIGRTSLGGASWRIFKNTSWPVRLMSGRVNLKLIGAYLANDSIYSNYSTIGSFNSFVIDSSESGSVRDIRYYKDNYVYSLFNVVGAYGLYATNLSNTPPSTYRITGTAPRVYGDAYNFFIRNGYIYAGMFNQLTGASVVNRTTNTNIAPTEEILEMQSDYANYLAFSDGLWLYE